MILYLFCIMIGIFVLFLSKKTKNIYIRYGLISFGILLFQSHYYFVDILEKNTVYFTVISILFMVVAISIIPIKGMGEKSD